MLFLILQNQWDMNLNPMAIITNLKKTMIQGIGMIAF